MSKINKNEAIYALESIVELQKKKESFVIFIPSKRNMSEDDLMSKEYELLGYYLTRHPLDNYTSKLASVDKIGDLAEYQSGRSVNVCGIVIECKVIQTKAGKTMAFLTLEDLTGRIEVIVFPNSYERYKHLLIGNALIEVSGKVEVEENENNDIEEANTKTAKILAMGIKNLEETYKIKEIILRLTCKEELEAIAKIIKFTTGNIPINIQYENFMLETSYKISQNKDVLSQLRELCLIKEIKE